jgi:hypothetical protein
MLSSRGSMASSRMYSRTTAATTSSAMHSSRSMNGSRNAMSAGQQASNTRRWREPNRERPSANGKRHTELRHAAEVEARLVIGQQPMHPLVQHFLRLWLGRGMT